MSEIDTEIRRVVLVLDMATEERGLVQAAAALAARLDAELSGLFIQDPRLMRFAALPLAAEVVRSSGRERDITPDRVAQELVKQARRITRELVEVAGTRGVRYAPVAARAHSEAEVLERAEQVDLLLVGKRAGGELVAPGALGSMASRLVAGASCPVILMEDQGEIAGPLMVLIEDLDAGACVMDLAERLAQAMQVPLSVVVSGASPRQSMALRTALEQRLMRRTLRVVFHDLVRPDLPRLADLLWREGADLLMVGSHARLVRSHSPGRVVTGLRSAVVLVP